MNKRYIIYPLVAIFTIGLMLLPQILSSPQRNIRSIANSIENSAGETQQSFSGYLKPYPNQKRYVLVIYTGSSPGFESVQFVAISKQKNKLLIDIITGPGIENVKQLQDKEAADFLMKHNIVLEDIDSKVFDD